MSIESKQRQRIPLIIAAHNEEKNIRQCLQSIMTAIPLAEAQFPLSISVFLGADRCSDRTIAIAQDFDITIIETSGGKVATQRACIQEAPFLIFCDADILLSAPTLRGMCQVMCTQPQAFVAYPHKKPLAPRRRSWLAISTHRYTRDEGFQGKRTWFDGKCFAIRDYVIPQNTDILSKIAALGQDHFYAFHNGLTIDDVYLSRWVVHNHGVDAIQQAPEGILWFRAAETYRGMYAYYRRIRRELERIDLLFPEMKITGKKFGYRRTSWKRFWNASLSAKAGYVTFQTVDNSFRPIYTLERLYYQYLATKDCDAWPVIPETKG